MQKDSSQVIHYNLDQGKPLEKDFQPPFFLPGKNFQDFVCLHFETELRAHAVYTKEVTVTVSVRLRASERVFTNSQFWNFKTKSTKSRKMTSLNCDLCFVKL